MSYISLSFMIFLGIGVTIYLSLPKKYQTAFLLLLNILFYLCADIRYIFYLAFTITSTFILARMMENNKYSESARIKILITGILFNLMLLIVSKYFVYLVNLVGQVASGRDIMTIKLLVPLGISFYTLQAISYLVDVYKKKIKCEKNFIVYATYLSYFPTVVQGPIVRYCDFKEQILKENHFNYDRIKQGLQLILYGLFKKMVIADRAAICVNDVWQNYAQYSKSWIILGVLLYSVQIYTDFSGCVDVCRGVSQILGIDIINNFNAPYFAISIKDFWRRWHISFSSWLRDYVYIPLGGNRKGKVRKHLNVLLTFAVSGVWHGVGINYLVWGFLHGFYQIIGEALLPVKKKIQEKCKIRTTVFSYKIMQRIITFSLVSFTWIFFRSSSLREAIGILRAIFINNWMMPLSAQNVFGFKDLVVILIGVMIVVVVSCFQQKYSVRKWINEQNLWFRWSIYFGAIFAIIVFGIYGSGYNTETFIYMQF